MTVADYEQQIRAALEHDDGSYTFEDVVAGVETGALQAWFGPASIIITELVAYPQYRAANFFLAGGELPELEAMTPGVLQWAKEQGCRKAIFAGRRGWERTFLTRTGWGPSKLVVLEKPL